MPVSRFLPWIWALTLGAPCPLAAMAGPRPPLPACPPGFITVPDTSTCLRVGGRVRADTVARGRAARSASGWRQEGEGRLTIDARTQTEHGPLRAVIDLRGRNR